MDIIRRLRAFLAIVFPASVRLGSAGIQLISTIIIARSLGDDDSAVFYYWIAVIVGMASVASFGLEHLISRTLPRIESNGPGEIERFMAQIRTFVLICAGSIGIALTVYAAISSDSGMQMWMLIIPVSLIIQSFLLLATSALNGLGRPTPAVIWTHFIPATVFCVASAAGLWTESIHGPGLVVLHGICFAAPLIYLRWNRQNRINGAQLCRLPISRITELAKQGGPMFLFGAFGTLTILLPLTLVNWYCTESDVAHVSTAFRITTLFALISTAIHNVFTPKLSIAFSNSPCPKDIVEIYGKAVLITLTCLALPLTAGIIFPEFIMTLFGDDFTAGATVLRWLFVFQFAMIFAGPYFQLAIMNGQETLLAKSTFVRLLITALLAFCITPTHGTLGFVAALAIPSVLHAIFTVWMVGKSLPLNNYTEQTAPRDVESPAVIKPVTG